MFLRLLHTPLLEFMHRTIKEMQCVLEMLYFPTKIVNFIITGWSTVITLIDSLHFLSHPVKFLKIEYLMNVSHLVS